MLRAAHWFATHGYRIDRVMTDNAMAYRRSQAFAQALAQIGAAHKLIRPYRPQTNGKVERFHQTLLRGWAYKQPYTTNQQRRQALTRFLNTYNQMARLLVRVATMETLGECSQCPSPAVCAGSKLVSGQGTWCLLTAAHHRPHSSLRGQPPIQLVTHLCGKDT